MYSRPRFKDAHLKSTLRFKDDIFSKSKVPRRYFEVYNYHRGVALLRHGPPPITAVVHLQSCTESGLLLLTLLRAGMETFLPSARGSSAAGLMVNQRASSSLNVSHRFTSALVGDPCMGFVVGDKTIFVAHKNHSIEHNLSLIHI